MKIKFSLFIQYRGAINKEKEKCSQALSTISRRNLSVSEVAISARFSNISLHHHPADQSQLCVSRLMIYVLGHQWRWTAVSHQLNHSLNNDKLMLQYHSRCLHLYLLTLPDYLLLLLVASVLVLMMLFCWRLKCHYSVLASLNPAPHNTHSWSQHSQIFH